MKKRKGRAPKVHTYNGISDDLSGWSKRTGISKGSLKNRLHLGWSLERVFTRPIQRGSDPIGTADAARVAHVFNAWLRSPCPTVPDPPCPSTPALLAQPPHPYAEHALRDEPQDVALPPEKRAGSLPQKMHPCS